MGFASGDWNEALTRPYAGKPDFMEYRNMNTEDTVTISRGYGPYNLCLYEKCWLLEIQLPGNRRVSALFDQQPPPDVEMPSEVVEIISDSIEKAWTSASREEDRKVIAWCRENAALIDAIYLRKRITEAKKNLAALENSLLNCEEEMRAAPGTGEQHEQA